MTGASSRYNKLTRCMTNEFVLIMSLSPVTTLNKREAVSLIKLQKNKPFLLLKWKCRSYWDGSAIFSFHTSAKCTFPKRVCHHGSFINPPVNATSKWWNDISENNLRLKYKCEILSSGVFRQYCAPQDYFVYPVQLPSIIAWHIIYGN